MKRKFRVTSHREFQAVVHSNKYEANRHFVVYTRPNDYSYPRLGISSPTKLGHAVIRNRVRRQIREMVRELWDELVPQDYVIIARKDFLTSDYKTNRDELHLLLTRRRRKKDEEIA